VTDDIRRDLFELLFRRRDLKTSHRIARDPAAKNLPGASSFSRRFRLAASLGDFHGRRKGLPLRVPGPKGRDGRVGADRNDSNGISGRFP
jgi:hypothetical protein